MTTKEKMAIRELQEKYEHHYVKGEYDACKHMIGVFCILNKHLTGQTGWRIRFEGSMADELVNVLADAE